MQQLANGTLPVRHETVGNPWTAAFAVIAGAALMIAMNRLAFSPESSKYNSRPWQFQRTSP
jgi:hypothetical protein